LMASRAGDGPGIDPARAGAGAGLGPVIAVPSEELLTLLKGRACLWDVFEASNNVVLTVVEGMVQAIRRVEAGGGARGSPSGSMRWRKFIRGNCGSPRRCRLLPSPWSGWGREGDPFGM